MDIRYDEWLPGPGLEGAVKSRGVRFDGQPKAMPYGTGVMLQDLYGNRIYLNQDPA